MPEGGEINSKVRTIRLKKVYKSVQLQTNQIVNLVLMEMVTAKMLRTLDLTLVKQSLKVQTVVVQELVPNTHDPASAKS